MTRHVPDTNLSTPSAPSVRAPVRTHSPWLSLLPLCFIGAVAEPVVASTSSTDEMLTTTPARFRMTVENVTLPKDEKMGFLGGTYLYAINDNVSLGPAAYGALTGDRGGFITLGGAAEFNKSLGEHYEFNTGLFVGAGGGRGGYTLSGGGLMLRYHAGVNYQTNNIGRFGAGLSYVDFPDGAIHSTQPYLSYEYPFRTLIVSGWKGSSGTQRRNKPASGHELSAIYKSYRVPDHVRADNGADQYEHIALTGMEWNKYLNDSVFLHTEAEGALGGRSHGYMQMLLGAGYRFRLNNSNAIKISGSAGVAGGGNVATGGGLLLDTQLSYQLAFTDHVYVEAVGGYTTAPDGDFEALSWAAKLGYAFDTPYVGISDRLISAVNLSGFNASHFRVRAAHQNYYKAAPNWRTHHNDLNVGNLGIQVDAFLTDHLFLTGQGLAAYSGQAGAYMTGLLGAGVHAPIAKSAFFVDGEILAGAAGGGGVSVGGGFVWQSNIGLGYQFNDRYSLIAQYGRMEAPEGNFKANVSTLSFGYNFSLYTR